MEKPVLNRFGYFITFPLSEEVFMLSSPCGKEGPLPSTWREHTYSCDNLSNAESGGELRR